MFPTWFVSIIPSSPSSPLALCDFGTAKVCDENVHVFVQKDIFRFQVSMNDALVMQIFHGSHQFCGVELCAVYNRDHDMFSRIFRMQIYEFFTNISQLKQKQIPYWS